MGSGDSGLDNSFEGFSQNTSAHFREVDLIHIEFLARLNSCAHKGTVFITRLDTFRLQSISPVRGGTCMILIAAPGW